MKGVGGATGLNSLPKNCSDHSCDFFRHIRSQNHSVALRTTSCSFSPRIRHWCMRFSCHFQHNIFANFIHLCSDRGSNRIASSTNTNLLSDTQRPVTKPTTASTDHTSRAEATFQYFFGCARFRADRF